MIARDVNSWNYFCFCSSAVLPVINCWGIIAPYYVFLVCLVLRCCQIGGIGGGTQHLYWNVLFWRHKIVVSLCWFLAHGTIVRLCYDHRIYSSQSLLSALFKPPFSFPWISQDSRWNYQDFFNICVTLVALPYRIMIVCSVLVFVLCFAFFLVFCFSPQIVCTPFIIF